MLILGILIIIISKVGFLVIIFLSLNFMRLRSYINIKDYILKNVIIILIMIIFNFFDRVFVMCINSNIVLFFWFKMMSLFLYIIN